MAPSRKQCAPSTESAEVLRLVLPSLIGECQICGTEDDVHYGLCYRCTDKACCEPHKAGFRFWESGNPENTWYCPKN